MVERTGHCTVNLCRRRAVFLLVALGLVVLLVPWGASGLGHWLMVADRLEPARAIVVLGGRVPFRVIEAASIYSGGWAGEIWLTKGARSAEEVPLDHLGVRIVRGEAYSRPVLEWLGVPAGRIRLLDDGVLNTVDEMRVIARELKGKGAEPVILVTSKTHSRRVRHTWSAIVGSSPRAIVRYATEEPYRPGRWWENTRDALDVSREVSGLMNVWVGFPVQPDRRQE